MDEVDSAPFMEKLVYEQRFYVFNDISNKSSPSSIVALFSFSFHFLCDFPTTLNKGEDSGLVHIYKHGVSQGPLNLSHGFATRRLVADQQQPRLRGQARLKAGINRLYQQCLKLNLWTLSMELKDTFLESCR